ncbi:site-specific DNA-methyltransferase [Candidatus Persebacteraceae bacterium Df01]|uniref:Site-specific DNA-methyltransferase n=1 Tax=Candidatus Doriopsillibacter californiensis TaxID=2970740 RepID=A0ABT7QL41_9GAMM|nr:site-specific DNA-methyltransferase [Candidatus Persebacteraceae bacterium Df01]
MNRIILSSSREYDTVLDSFCGSATTGVSILYNKRIFIGIESEWMTFPYY